MSKAKILLVDDEKHNHVIIAEMLALFDCEFVSAYSGKEAISVLGQGDIVGVLLDAEMPDMDGYQVLNQMQSDKDLCHIPTMLLTTHLSEKRQNLHSEITQAVDFINKPIKKEILFEKLRLIINHHRYRNVVRQLDDEDERLLKTRDEGVLGVDGDGVIVFCNAASVRMFDTTMSNLIGTYIETILEEPCHNVVSEWTKHPIYEACESGNILHVKKAKFYRCDSECFEASFAAVPVKKLEGMHSLFAIKEIKKDEEGQKKLASLSHRDHLTGLPTRVLFEDALSDGLNNAKHHDSHLAVLHVDLDHFRYINESLGHTMGDRLLIEASERLKKGIIRKTDMLARLAGDEFLILLEDLKSPEDVQVVAQKILVTMREPYLIDGHEICIGASIGLAVYPNCGTSAKVLLQNAEAAAQRAKLQGRNNFQYYTLEMNKKNMERLELDTLLHSALDEKQIDLKFMPILDLQSNTISGFELKSYWHAPNRKIMQEDEYFPFAEESGLILEIGNWILNEACVQLKNWLTTKGFLDDTFVSISVSAAQLSQANFVNYLSEIIEQAGLDISHIQIHLSETVMMGRGSQMEETIDLLQKRGFKISVSDFGRGYGTLELLRKTMVDNIKIGGNFVENIEESETERSILKNLINMAHDLDISVTVDSVSTHEQAAILSDFLCDFIQGPCISEPLDVDNVQTLLSESDGQIELSSDLRSKGLNNN